MVFSKSFPKNTEKYPEWKEILLDSEEEAKAEQEARQENIELMQECIDDAKQLISEKGFSGFKEDILQVAIALFEKRASHAVYFKERKCKDKFHDSKD